jgi:alpha-L-rhamnosidase
MAPSPPHVDTLRAGYRRDTGVVGIPLPPLSWTTIADVHPWMQGSAELEWSSAASTRSVVLEGADSVLVPWPFDPLLPRQRGELRVRVAGSDGVASDWSEPLELTAGFLADGEWVAQHIAPADAAELQPFLARREFDVRPGLLRATLYATAHGAYQVEVNGIPVDDEVLKPGWTAYQHRLVHETTDVTSSLREGANTLLASVAGGWYTESYGFFGRSRPFYGTRPSFATMLVLEYSDGDEVVATDASWRVASDGPVVASGIYAGESYDARRVPTWLPAVRDEAAVIPVARQAPAVRVIEELPVAEVLSSPSGRRILDFGQNLVGVLRIRVSGPAGTTITLRHAEVLEEGELSTRPLRTAAATDSYTLSGDGVEVWQPAFTFHGFRYAEVEGWPGTFDAADATALVIHSDMERTGWFDSSNALVNRLHDNVVWSMRGNFLSIPTDCPQRDERLGWTGDLQVFSPTAAFLYDCNGFLDSWLTDLALVQRENGSVPFAIPDVLPGADAPATAWGDAVAIVPWTLYQRFGDLALLRPQLTSMRRWVDLLLGIAGERHLWEGYFQFGDWLDPDAPIGRPADAKTHSDIVASAYLFRSTSIVSEAAELLGDSATATRYRDAAEAVRSAWLAEYVTPASRIVSDAQTAYALALEFGIVTDPVIRERMGDRLAWLVRRDGYRIGTGFVGTPLVQDALTSTGHVDTAVRLLLQTEAPSWLYPVTQGATTIWERWDSLLEDGSVNPNEMTSFNHYAFGAIGDWLHRVVAGLAPAEPGYRRLRIAPVPMHGFDRASAEHLTPYGLAAAGWSGVDGRIVVTATVPANTTADILLPDGTELTVGSGEHRWDVADSRTAAVYGAVDAGTSLAEVVDDREAYAAILDAMTAVDPAIASEFRRRTRWIPERTLLGEFVMLPPHVTDSVEAALAELTRTRTGG